MRHAACLRNGTGMHACVRPARGNPWGGKYVILSMDSRLHGNDGDMVCWSCSATSIREISRSKLSVTR
jgi:hypothetical protein